MGAKKIIVLGCKDPDRLEIARALAEKHGVPVEEAGKIPTDALDQLTEFLDSLQERSKKFTLASKGFQTFIPQPRLHPKHQRPNKYRNR